MSEAGEIIKSGAVDKVADIFHKLAGPMADEVGMMLGDKVRVWRANNWTKTVKKTERILKDAGLPANAVPPRLFLPIVEGSSMEDNESLQDMWAGLLATASQEMDAVSPAFVETLKQLRPDEAQALQKMYERVMRSTKLLSGKWTRSLTLNALLRAHVPNPLDATTSENLERLGLLRRQYNVRNIPTAEDLAEENFTPVREPEVVYRLEFTRFAVGFLQACQGPPKRSEKISE